MASPSAGKSCAMPPAHCAPVAVVDENWQYSPNCTGVCEPLAGVKMPSPFTVTAPASSAVSLRVRVPMLVPLRP